MKKLQFFYEMNLKFSASVIRHSFALRCTPKQTPCQAIGALTCEFRPFTAIAVSTDSFHNLVYTGYIKEPHTSFSFRISGTAVTNSENYLAEPLHPLFKYPSPLACLSLPAAAFFPGYLSPSGDNLQRSLYLMELLYNKFTYKSGTTNNTYTAEAALKQGYGVCQDYAHILIAMCRQEGIAARYVAGFMIGEGVTHAWVEIYARGKWIGLDPTHNRIVDDLYIKLADGRDFSDCAIDRGVFIGSALQEQQVIVRVSEHN